MRDDRESISVLDEPGPRRTEWLTLALRSALSCPDARVARLRCETIGAGRPGGVTRLHVGYVPEAAGPETVVVKLPPTGRARQEAWFYDRIAPNLPSPGPRCHGTADDPTTGAPVIVLEDIRGGRWPNDLAGAPADVARTLDAIAPLHAAGWGCPSAAAGLPGWPGERATWPGYQERYREWWSRVVGLFGLALPTRIHTTATLLCDHLTGVLERLDAAPKTVVHGNLHLDNVVFRADDPRCPVTVLDWHRVSSASAAVDVAAAITTSLSVDDRRSSEEHLLRGYRRKLAALGVATADLADLDEQYVLALILHFAAAVGRLASSVESGGCPRVGDSRLITALLDHDAEQLIAR